MLCDLLLSEGRLSVDPEILNFNPQIDRGELITSNGPTTHEELQALPDHRKRCLPARHPRRARLHHTVSSDEHDEDGVLISDEYTNAAQASRHDGKAHAQGDRHRSRRSAARAHRSSRRRRDAHRLGLDRRRHRGGTRDFWQEQGITANQLQIRWLVPLHGDAIVNILKNSRHTIIVENNYSGQFARYLRSETSFVPDGHIRKYDGEPFMPHHIVEAVKEQLAGNVTMSVPTHEIMV